MSTHNSFFIKVVLFYTAITNNTEVSSLYQESTMRKGKGGGKGA